MSNGFLTNLRQIGLESANQNFEAEYNPYPTSECAEERLALDVIEDTQIAMEDANDAYYEQAFEVPQIAMEAAGFSSLDELANFTGELAMESVTNAIKRGGYSVQIQLKKIGQRMMKVAIALLSYFTVSDGKLKSYNKLLKKYKEKLSKLNPASVSDPDKEEPEYEIRDWSKLNDLYKKCVADADLQTFIDTAGALANITDYSTIGTALTTVVNRMVGVLKPGADITTMNDEDIDSTIEDTKSDLIEAAKDDIKDVTTDIEKIDGDFSTLKTSVLNWLTQSITDTAKDLKFKQNLTKLRNKANKINKKMDKIDEGSVKQARIISKIFTHYTGLLQKTFTIKYKALTSGYQGLLSDTAKLLSAGTRIKG